MHLKDYINELNSKKPSLKDFEKLTIEENWDADKENYYLNHVLYKEPYEKNGRSLVDFKNELLVDFYNHNYYYPINFFSL